MTINYVGERAWKHRLAEFSYRENETERFMKIAESLRETGYDIDTGCEGWAAIRVDDRNEYNQVVEDYRKAKRLIKK